MLLRLLILVVTLLLAQCTVLAQDKSANRRAQAAYEQGGEFLQRQEWAKAMRSLKSAIDLDPTFALPHQQLGDIYRRQANYHAAIMHYRAVLDLAPSLTPLTHFGLGESLLHTAHYAEALMAFEIYLRGDDLQEASIEKAKKYIADCQFSMTANVAVLDSALYNAGSAINSEADEYFPSLTADQNTIIFTRKTDNQENFYMSVRDSVGEWQPATPLKGAVNSKQHNEGAHCISPDGKYLFFTGCNRPDGLGSCDIYVSRREGDQWGTPHNLGAPINTRGWEAQPSLSADGRTLFFVSNRQGGQGGYDIWRSTLLHNGKWSQPRNLGPKINTAYDESSPYIHADNQTLYFASNGWPGFGDKDIFKSRMDENGEWLEPTNLGRFVNDHHEQSALTVSMNGREAFFSSRRHGGMGGLDIYHMNLPPALQPQSVAYLKGRILDATDGSTIHAEVTITDVHSQKLLFRDVADYEDGTFLAPLPFGNTYALHVKHPGYMFFSENYPLADSSKVNDAYEVEVYLMQIQTGKTETLNNIFFDINKYELLPESQSDLDNLVQFLTLNNETHIEIGGHTDDTGSEDYNQRLSENRAKAVFDYLVEEGVAAKRLSYRGYGQHEPVADNETPEGRQQNRRTDMKIIK